MSSILESKVCFAAVGYSTRYLAPVVKQALDSIGDLCDANNVSLPRVLRRNDSDLVGGILKRRNQDRRASFCHTHQDC